jgi:hypothetical protein
MTFRNLLFLVLTALLLALLPISAFAQSAPIAGCPLGFHFHMIGDHHDGEEHFHAGTAADQNGDGWICATHVSVDGSIHVHIDNQVPFN